MLIVSRMSASSYNRILTMDPSFMLEIARRQKQIRFILGKGVLKLLLCKATTLAYHSSIPSNTLVTSPLKLGPTTLLRSDRTNCLLHDTTTSPNNPHHNLIVAKRTFCTSRIYQQPVCPRPDASMLAKYYTRFMSTARSSLFGADVEQLESDQVVDLLSNPKTNKTVTIKACGKLYFDLTKERPILYSGAPVDGIQFEVQYYDSLELLEPTTSQQKHATVCLLHGAPGHYKDFTSLINYLASQSIRVIAPNFPDYSATFNHSFRHSPRERLDFLIEYFKTIGVGKYEMIIGHSSAVYTLFELLNYSLNGQDNSAGIQVKSLGLFSTPSHVLPHNLAVTPLRLFTLKLFDYSILRPFILTFVRAFVKMQGIRNRVDENKIENLLIAASAMGYSEHERMADHLKLARHNRIPTLLVYGTKDRLITRYNFIQLERDLGITGDDQVKCYKSDGTIERATKEEPSKLVEVSRFESGGHYTFQKYSSQVNKDVLRFLRRHVLEAPKSVEATRL